MGEVYRATDMNLGRDVALNAFIGEARRVKPGVRSIVRRR
jgi:hypothetical protein